MTQIRRHTFIVATAGALVLTCSSVAAAAFGVGTRGNDTVNGTDGRDMLLGLAGDDAMSGFGSEDLILGGRGNDVIDGGPGSDALYGELGDDVMSAVDGERDAIRCGPGNDSVTADAIDRVARDCEMVTIDGQGAGVPNDDGDGDTSSG